MRFYLDILSYGRSHLNKVPVAALLLLLYNIFAAGSLTLLIPFLEILFATAAPEAPAMTTAEAIRSFDGTELKANFFQWLYGLMQAYGKPQVLFWFCLTVGAAILLKNLFRYFSLYVIAPLEYNALANLRATVFGKLTDLSLGFYTRKRRGHLNNLMTTDMQYVQDALIGTIHVVLSDPLTLLVLLGAMLMISWKLTLFTLAVLPLTGWFIARIATRLKRKTHRAQGLLDHLMSVVDEFIGGVRVVKAFSAEDYIRRKYAGANADYTRTIIHMRRLNDLASPVTEVLGFGVGIAIILYGGNLILQGAELKPSEFITFIVLFTQFIAPIRTFSAALNRITRARASYERISLLLHEPVLPTEAPGQQAVHAFEQAIQVQDLSFRYGPDRDILRNIHLEVKRGETLALVGPSGSGKTTLVDLICRFYDPNSGRILFDGTDLHQIDGRSLRRLMGIVTQEGILFNDSIANNIAYGDERFSLADIERAARIANAHEFIQQLPQGYETVIGERGLALSGGQRQRIAIARAVLKNPPILILDEATSALDTESERLVQQALDRLMQGRTVIVIAHRLSTVQHADQIVVLRDGEIVERGNHQRLLAQDGVYTKLYQMQFARQDEPAESPAA